MINLNIYLFFIIIFLCIIYNYIYFLRKFWLFFTSKWQHFCFWYVSNKIQTAFMQPIITLRRLLEQKLNIDSATLSPSTNLKKDLEMSEWEWDYLLNSIEQAWKISLPSSEINEVVNVRHLLAVVKKQRPNKFSKS